MVSLCRSLAMGSVVSLHGMCRIFHGLLMWLVQISANCLQHLRWFAFPSFPPFGWLVTRMSFSLYKTGVAYPEQFCFRTIGGKTSSNWLTQVHLEKSLCNRGFGGGVGVYSTFVGDAALDSPLWQWCIIMHSILMPDQHNSRHSWML